MERQACGTVSGERGNGRASARSALRSPLSALRSWIDERIELEPILSLMAKKTVPVHRASWVYMLGGAALFLFALQVASGILLMLYYQPSVTTDQAAAENIAGAYESVQKIMAEVPFGRMVRSVHAWGASFFIAIVGLHFLVKLFTAAYRKPRELTWVCGGLLLFVALAFGFSGYLLPWNELSYHATKVGTAIPGTLLGDWATRFLLGGQEVSGDTVTRFFAAHVMLLPLASGLLLAVHLGLIQAQGMSLPLGMSKEKLRDEMPFFSELLLIEACIWLLIFATIVTLAAFFPAQVGVKADPLKAPPPGIKPEWYFLFIFQTFEHVPKTLGVLLFTLGAVFLLAVPFLDRKAMREERSSWLTGLFVLLLVYAVGFEIWAISTPSAEHPPGEGFFQRVDFAADLVLLALFWTVIGFTAFYLRQLQKENSRIRHLYHQNTNIGRASKQCRIVDSRPR